MNILKLRAAFIDETKKIPMGERLTLSSLKYQEYIEDILFDYDDELKCKHFSKEVKPYLRRMNFTGIDFTNFYCKNFNFMGLKGVKINPQTIYAKDLTKAKCKGVLFTGPFDDVCVVRTSFKGSKGARINPQTVKDKDLRKTKCADVKFIGPFNGVKISGTDFESSTCARINPQTIFGKDLRKTRCTSVEFFGSFDDAIIEETNFKGSVGARIAPENTRGVIVNTVFTDAEIIERNPREMVSEEKPKKLVKK